MTDHLTEAVKEMQNKSPFVCVSCGHPHDIAKVLSGKPIESHRDHLTEAFKESEERSAFTCESCGHKQAIKH